MTTTREIEDRVDALSERVRKLHSGDWVAISYHSGSWWARCHFARIGSQEGVSPVQAMDAFERALFMRERQGDTLAATLGIEPAQ